MGSQDLAKKQICKKADFGAALSIMKDNYAQVKHIVGTLPQTG